jgi:hypothetical protein
MPCRLRPLRVFACSLLVGHAAWASAADNKAALRQSLSQNQKSATRTAPVPDKHFPATPTTLPQWKNYLLSLSAYQKAFPGLYPPLDLVRWDRIPLDWLKPQVRKHGLIWERAESRDLNFDDRRTERVALSRKSNQELFEKLSALQKQGTLWVGSTRTLLDSFSSEERLALTPLDEAFQQSELGKLLFDRFRSKSSELLSGFLVDPKAQRLILEIGESNSDGESGSVPSQYFKVEFDLSNKAEVRIRPSFGRDERLGSDISQRKENFRGYLLNAESNERLPLGPYPARQNRWVDERGTAHFHGDGHKH